MLRVGVRRTGFISTDIEVTLQVREDSSPTNNVNGVSGKEVILSPPYTFINWDMHHASMCLCYEVAEHLQMHSGYCF